jgi:hypothetical protein
MLDPFDRASLYLWTQIEASGLKNTMTMDKVQKTDTNDLAPSSKTFRDEIKTYHEDECLLEC